MLNLSTFSLNLFSWKNSSKIKDLFSNNIFHKMKLTLKINDKDKQYDLIDLTDKEKAMMEWGLTFSQQRIKILLWK